MDLTVVVNAHREGLIAVPTIRSIDLAISACRRSGIDVEVIVVLDKADDLTSSIFHRWGERLSVKLFTSSLGDLGLARNLAVSAAAGKWIAFVDADDLVCETWLSEAFRNAESREEHVVWHPEYNIVFGTDPHIYLHIDMEDPHYDPTAIAITNLWTALCFASRSMLTSVPYKKTDLSAQIGYEDWGWAMETLANGAIHKTVRGTAHAIRKKRVSLVQQTTAAGCIPHPSKYFLNLLGNVKESC